MGMSKLKTTDYLKNLEYDPMDAESVVEVLKEILTTDELEVPEQRLFVIGFVVNKNKEDYIISLKKRLNNAKTSYRQLKSKGVAVPKKPAQSPKKKYIVRRKKTTDG